MAIAPTEAPESAVPLPPKAGFEGTAVCPVCRYMTTSQEALALHVETKHGEKPARQWEVGREPAPEKHPCPQCDFVASSAGGLGSRQSYKHGTTYAERHPDREPSGLAVHIDAAELHDRLSPAQADAVLAGTGRLLVAAAGGDEEMDEEPPETPDAEPVEAVDETEWVSRGEIDAAMALMVERAQVLVLRTFFEALKIVALEEYPDEESFFVSYSIYKALLTVMPTREQVQESMLSGRSHLGEGSP